jgi:DNA-binding Xre family transcriptional regulator
MLELKIKEVMQASGISKPLIFLQKAGFSKRKAMGLLAKTQKTFTLLDLSRLCQLLQCTPNDLMYWQPTPRLVVDSAHPLVTKLQAAPTHANWLDLVGQLPKADVLQLHEEVAQKIRLLKSGVNGTSDI